MIKVEHSHDDSHSLSVAIEGPRVALLIEAMGVCDGIRRMFEDDEAHSQELTELACKVLRGEVGIDQAQVELAKIVLDDASVKNILKEIAQLMRDLDGEEETLEC